jgi:two-component system, cell cycle sensor histidine kinase and response regulator CckA
MKAVAEQRALGAVELPIRVLLLGNSPSDSQDILEELRAVGLMIEPTVVETRHEFWKAVAAQPFSVVIATNRADGWSVLEAIDELAKKGKVTALIVVAEHLEKEEVAECVRLGVTDYVAKNDLVRLPAIFQRVLREEQLRHENEEARRALRESEARNRERIENSVYGIFRVDLEGSFLFANSALLQILACSSMDVLESLSDVFRFPEHCARLVSACRKNGLVHSSETEWRRNDGGLVAVKLHLRHMSVPGAGEQIEGLVEDVTELRSLEQQLLQAQKFETVGQLAGGVAHDFNNVVGAILGWAELGYEESLAFPRIAERFTRIREQADRAAKLTRELLAFARCQQLQPHPIDLNTIVENLGSLLDKVISSEIEIRVNSGVLDPIQADPVQIEQVLMNLCLNARDAMPQGGRLTIATEMERIDEAFCRFYRCTAPGKYAVLSVSDTGIGMTPEIRERIFEPFFTTKEKGVGTGMGLATAYGIVKQHGGFIHVYSEPLLGSLFRVYLPVVADAGSVNVNPEPTVSPAAMRLEGTETILLAEDHDSIREMVRQWLANLGYRVLAAANGEEATRLSMAERPHVAILDMVMPKMGGVATVAELRSRFADLPVVLTSGYCEWTHAEELANCHYVRKPYSPTELVRLVRKVLDSRSWGKPDQT